MSEPPGLARFGGVAKTFGKFFEKQILSLATLENFEDLTQVFQEKFQSLPTLESFNILKKVFKLSIPALEYFTTLSNFSRKHSYQCQPWKMNITDSCPTQHNPYIFRRTLNIFHAKNLFQTKTIYQRTDFYIKIVFPPHRICVHAV